MHPPHRHDHPGTGTPVLAPAPGAQLLYPTSWSSVFVTLTLLGLVILPLVENDGVQLTTSSSRSNLGGSSTWGSHASRLL
ncbi:hypothetical protein [Streptomyces sp. NPDC005476]|uniref:hypothetical protein n=1 Tax=Streptomyces sp. NPDC005476 TaxID=3156882 RepID=UPI0034538806